MRSKRLLAMLLALCLVLSAFSPVAFAAEAGEDSYVNAGQNTQENATTETDASAAEDQPESGSAQGALTLRDNPLYTVEAKENETEGSWDFAPVDAPSDSSLLLDETPACLEELKQAAELFDKNEVVTAFVVMETQPLAETHSSILLVDPTVERQMIERQDLVISAIEKNVLSGEKLDVRYQFTYLTNSFSVRTEFRNLQKIAELDGVKSVFVMPVYNPAEVTEGVTDPLATASGVMTGVPSLWENLGYTGEGMKIAVIDTGLDLDHKSFAADPETTDDSMTADDIAAVLEELNAYDLMDELTVEDLYRSVKVPYAFNYVDRNLSADHSRDNQGDHGTHVAGIAAANANVEGTDVVGMAPDAQLIIMKVFGAAGGAYMDDIVAALEDAMRLGCDAANLSLGTTAGFSSSDSELDLIYERIASQDTIVLIAAGNDGTSSYGNMWGTDLNTTANPDNATVNSPSIYANAMSVASANNAAGMYTYFTVGETKVPYTESTGLNVTFNSLAAQGELEYVVIPGLGAAEDFEGLDVTGKIALVQRGTLNFSEKLANAEAAGAIGLVVYNNVDNDELIGMDMTDPTTGGLPEGVSGKVPAVSITLPDGQMMIASETKTMTVSAEQGIVPLAIGGQMSAFSSWGVSPDLGLAPDITGIGGNVYSTVDAGKYGVMNGTSMATPQIAGISVLVMQYLRSEFPNAADGQIRELTEALLMSTAVPVVTTASGVEASPRQQGAGLVNAKAAVESGVYLTVGGGKPEAELGDGTTGTYLFSFEIHNFSDADKTYTLDSSLLTEDIVGYMVSETEAQYFMAEQDMALTGSVTFDKDTVTVPAGGITYVEATVTLSDWDKALFETYWENGGYVEGFVYLNSADENGVDLSLPFLGFYGDWTQAPVFDDAFWYENSFFTYPTVDGLPDGNEYFTTVWVDLAGTDWVLGVNPYTGALLGEDGKVIYDPANNSVSPNGDGVLDGIDEFYISLMRNAKTLTFTYTDTATGEILRRETYLNNSKTMYMSNYGQVVPWLYGWYGMDMYDFTDANGETLPNGTKIMLTIQGTVDYGTGGDHVLEIPITVDTQAPQLVNVYELPQEDGTQILVVEASEDVNLAYAALMNPTGTRYMGEAIEFEKTENGTYLAAFDITGLGTEFRLALCDFGANEGYYELTYTSGGDNLPEMDTDALYAYRIHDSAIMSDSMFGWISVVKPENADEDGYLWVENLTNEYMEYYALTAADYAGGKVFAVDAGYNFLVMEPGLWNRQLICNLGVPVQTLAFDDTTDTMYALSKNGSYTTLYSIDLLTGELTEVKYFGYYYYAPYIMAVADDGTIYAIQYQSGTLYTVDPDSDYAMTAVTDSNGVKVTIKTSAGSNARPNYAQSMTWSDGKLYWAYFYGSYSSNIAELITIDTENDYTCTYNPFVNTAYDSEGNAVDYQSDNELVGLLTLEETDYTIPESTTVESIWLDTTSAIVYQGDTYQITVNPIPWNVELTDVTWTSSDDTVATVEDGLITAVSEGVVTITAAYGELTASCEITVVEISGSFYAYDYYNTTGAYGDMIHMDLADLDYDTIGVSPVDFIAGDFNGHDGCFYGYIEAGQFYRLDMETGAYTAIGAGGTVYPQDMAYDYTTGTMYAIGNQGSGLYTVNLQTGEMVLEASGYGPLYWTLACDAEGQLWSVTTTGELCKLYHENGSLTFEIVMSGLGYLSYVQSMCYDYENDVLLWATPEYSTIAWIEHNAEEPYVLSLGNPFGSGASFEFMGMFTIPETIPELDDVAVEEVSLAPSEKVMVVGAEYTPVLSVRPTNANGYTMTWTSADTSIATVKSGGVIKAVAPGETTITCTVADSVSGNSWEVSMTLTVLEAADDVYGFLIDAGAWIQLDVSNPSNLAPINFSEYVMYAGEYHDGKVYTVAYNPTEWREDMWQLLVFDAQSFTLESATRLPAGFPFVYDMTYDYTTSTMFCVAGPTETESDLYMMNMETGELTLVMDPDQMLMQICAGPNGELYVTENYSRNMYVIDLETETMELLTNNGPYAGGLGAMTYDYDTGYIYTSSSIIDPATGETHSLGGSPGTVSALFMLCENFPAESESPVLKNLFISEERLTLNAGSSVVLTASALPMPLTDSVTWSSSNEKVATVDENGVVTGVAQGKATITATVTDGTNTISRSCDVSVLDADASFLTYNITDGGWAHISRADVGVVTNLTEGVEETMPTAIASIGMDVYGFDEENNFFRLNTETYERTVIGTAEAVMTNVTLVPDEGMTHFVVRDLAYDSANDRMLALGVRYGFNAYGQMQEFYDGAAIYVVDMETGVLELLYTFSNHHTINAMTVDDKGIIYFYNTYDHWYTALDLEAGTYTNIISGSTQSAYGDDDGQHDMYYDELTGLIYHLFTSNSTFYRMWTVNPETAELTNQGFIGEVVSQGYYNYTDNYSGLTFLYVPEAPAAEIVAVSASMNGNIGLNFYATLSEELAADETVYMQFIANGKTIEVPLSDAKVVTSNGVTQYRFTCELAAAEMTEQVTAQICNGSGAVSESVAYSVQKYADYIIANYDDEATVALMEAMLNYGAYAQIHFEKNVDALANANLADTSLPETVDASAYAHTTSGSADGLTVNGYSLLMKSETTLRVYFTLAEGKSIEDYVLTIDGEAVTAVADGSRYYVELTGIAAPKLDEMHEFNLGGFVLNCSGLSYVNNILSHEDLFGEDVLDLVKALYVYNQAANAYFG